MQSLGVASSGEEHGGVKCGPDLDLGLRCLFFCNDRRYIDGSTKLYLCDEICSGGRVPHTYMRSIAASHCEGDTGKRPSSHRGRKGEVEFRRKLLLSDAY